MPFYYSLKRFLLFSTVFALASSFLVSYAEGSKQLMPDTSSRAALSTQSSTDDFASYYSGSINRLYIHIEDATNEVVYLNFSLGYGATASSTLGTGASSTNYYFRIKDSTGSIVYGPKRINDNPIPSGTVGYDQVTTGPNTLYTGGYSPYTFVPSSGNGDYYIEFNKTDSVVAMTDQCSFDYWDITVANTITNTAIDGRVWAWSWGFYSRDYSSSDGYTGTFKGKLYSYSDSGVVESIDFTNSGLRGGSFRLGLSSTGPGTSGDIQEDRKSVANTRAVGEDFKMFLNDPDSAVYPTGVLDTNALTLSTTPIGCDATSTTIYYDVSTIGTAEIILDFNKDGDYDDGTRDRLLANLSDAVGADSIVWDLKDGLGDDVSSATDSTVDLIIRYGQSVSHLCLADVEYFTDGFIPVVVRPLPPTPYTPKLFYDDADMRAAIDNVNREYPDTTASFTDAAQPVATALNGCIAPCHLWSNFGTSSHGDMKNNAYSGYGNKNSVNTWWYSYREKQLFTLNFEDCSVVPLPVSAGNLEVKSKNCNNYITWNSYKETAFQAYEIQKGYDGKAFQTIATVKPQGSGSTYEYLDRNVNEDNSLQFYRLKMIDIDGSIAYSNIATVKLNCLENNITVYPNPVGNNLKIDGLNEGDKVRVTSLTGALVHETQALDSHLNISLEAINPGTYSVAVYRNNTQIKTINVVKVDSK